MQENFITDKQALDKAANQRIANIISITLNHLLDKVENKKNDIDEILNTFSRKGERNSALTDFISTYFDNLFKDEICVPLYIQKMKAKQDIYVYIGTHWKFLLQQQVIDFVRDCCRKMGLLDSLTGSYDFMNPLIEQIAFRRSRHTFNRAPANEVWINMQNGTLEIHDDGSVKFREHRSSDFFNYCLNYGYEPNAQCPKWESFLNEVLPEQQMQMLLAEYVGYCFTKNMKLEKMAVFYGTGCNGKSVTMDVIEHILGKENVSHVSLSSATTDDENRTHLEGKLVNISPESNKNIDAATLKQLVSGEPINVRKLYVGSYVIYDYAKLITSFNVLPPVESSFGYFRRWLLFPFNVTISDDKQDINLVYKLCDELPGIMNWILEGLKRLATTKCFTESEMCKKALKDYQLRSNTGLSFLADRCEVNDEAKTKLKDLYSSYLSYCAEEGIIHRMLKKTFRDSLKTYGAECSSINNIFYYNVKIKYTEE